MSGRSRYTDDDLAVACQQIEAGGSKPSINSLLAICPIGRSRAVAFLKSWHLAQSERAIEAADLPTAAIDVVVSAMKGAFAPLILEERKSAREQAQGQVNALTGLLNESQTQLAELEAEKSQLQKDLEQKSTECSNLDAELLKSQGECQSIENQLQAERGRNDELTKQVVQLQEKLTAVESIDADDLKGQVVRLKVEVEQERQRREESEQRERSISDAWAVGRKQIEQLEKELAGYGAKLNEMSELVKKQEEQIREQLSDIRAERGRYGALLSALQKIGVNVDLPKKPWADEKRERSQGKHKKDSSTQQQPSDTTEQQQTQEQDSIEQEQPSDGQEAAIWTPKNPPRKQLQLMPDAQQEQPDDSQDEHQTGDSSTQTGQQPEALEPDDNATSQEKHTEPDALGQQMTSTEKTGQQDQPDDSLEMRENTEFADIPKPKRTLVEIIQENERKKKEEKERKKIEKQQQKKQQKQQKTSAKQPQQPTPTQEQREEQEGKDSSQQEQKSDNVDVIVRKHEDEN